MQGYHPSYSYVMVSWLRWWIPQMTCGKLFLLQHSLATSLLEQKKNLFWRLPSWVNLLSLFLVKNEDVSVWFNIIWLGMQIEIRVKYQGWKFYILKNYPQLVIHIDIEKIQIKNGSHIEHNVTRFLFDPTLIFLPCPFSFDGTWIIFQITFSHSLFTLLPFAVQFYQFFFSENSTTSLKNEEK